MLNVQNLEAVLKLAAQSGDRIIILSENHEPLVIMNLANYQDLLAKNSQKIQTIKQPALDEINRDLALLHDNQASLSIVDDYNLDQFKIDASQKSTTVASDQIKTPVIETEEEEKYYIEPVD